MVFAELGFERAPTPCVAKLAGAGKMFAVGDNRALIAQRNGCGLYPRLRGLADGRDGGERHGRPIGRRVRAAVLEVCSTAGRLR